MNRIKNAAERQGADKAKDSRRMIHPKLSCFMYTSTRKKTFSKADSEDNLRRGYEDQSNDTNVEP